METLPIDEYIETDGEGRFFKSLKKFLPEANYNGTEVHNLKLSCSDLISVFLREMRLRANDFTKTTTEKVIMEDRRFTQMIFRKINLLSLEC